MFKLAGNMADTRVPAINSNISATQTIKTYFIIIAFLRQPFGSAAADACAAGVVSPRVRRMGFLATTVDVFLPAKGRHYIVGDVCSTSNQMHWQTDDKKKSTHLKMLKLHHVRRRPKTVTKKNADMINKGMRSLTKTRANDA